MDTHKRFNLYLSRKGCERLDSLRERTEAATISEVFRNALKAYEREMDRLDGQTSEEGK